jgi:hypothetical protein
MRKQEGHRNLLPLEYSGYPERSEAGGACKKIVGTNNRQVRAVVSAEATQRFV